MDDHYALLGRIMRPAETANVGETFRTSLGAEQTKKQPAKLGSPIGSPHPLPRLALEAPELLERWAVPSDPGAYALLFRSAVESLRGRYSAETEEKRRFIKVILEYLQSEGLIAGWFDIGSKGLQDYRVDFSDGYSVCVEAKGAGDGRNTEIWQRPAWADEFIIWSQNPNSLSHQPGHGVWSAIATRLFPKIIDEKVIVDAYIFFDGRCGSAIRNCPKKFGVDDALRSQATEIQGQDGRAWMPPPCIYLMPRTLADPETNPNPPLHDAESCRFAGALLQAFRVPREQWRASLNWARVESKLEPQGKFIKVSTGVGLDEPATVESKRFKKVKRTG